MQEGSTAIFPSNTTGELPQYPVDFLTNMSEKFVLYVTRQFPFTCSLRCGPLSCAAKRLGFAWNVARDTAPGSAQPVA